MYQHKFRKVTHSTILDKRTLEQFDSINSGAGTLKSRQRAASSPTGATLDGVAASNQTGASTQ